MGLLIYIILLIPSLIFKLILKLKKDRIWLITETGHTACDNGFYLFKHIRKYHPKRHVYYVISKKSKEYNKALKYGNIISFGSLKHYLYYMVAVNITTYENSSPCPWLFNFLHIKLNLYNRRVFIQRGITKDNILSLHYDKTKFKLFICGASKEYEYLKENYGYPKENLKLLGLPRFDDWINSIKGSNKILIMPSYRKVSKSFTGTKYFKRWNSLLNNKQFLKLLKQKDIYVYFYLHTDMQKYMDLFEINSSNIIKITDSEINSVLKESALLITDYSSVYMDFAYMNKPVIYYHFDYADYRKHYKEGYYKYSKDAFGKIVNDEEDLVKKIDAYIKMNYKMEDFYLKRMDKFFEHKDNLNSERVYMAIDEMGD